MTVSDLIEFLKQQPQDIQVAIQMYSDYKLLDFKEIETVEMCNARSDGWIESARPDKQLQSYMLFPGN